MGSEYQTNFHGADLPCDSLFIIMPFYNASTTLARAVLSLQCIDTKNRSRVYLVGVDDGSTDVGAEVFSKNAEKVEGIRWVKLEKQNGGSGSARNEGLRFFAKGWVLFLDADDELIADPFTYLDRSSHSSAVLFGAVLVREGKVLGRFRPHCPGPEDLPRIFTVRNPYSVISVVFRRESMTNFFDDGLKYLEDWHFFAINLNLFETCQAFPSVVLGKVHSRSNSKSSDQYNNGFYRLQVADKLQSILSERLGRSEKNNLLLQKAIGRIQMGERRRFNDFLKIPASPALLLKFIVYALFYRVYLDWYPYRK